MVVRRVARIDKRGMRATGNETETEKKAATGMKMSVMAISAETESGQ